MVLMNLGQWPRADALSDLDVVRCEQAVIVARWVLSSCTLFIDDTGATDLLLKLSSGVRSLIEELQSRYDLPVGEDKHSR